MAKISDLSREIVEEIKTYYEKNELSNVQVASMYKDMKVTEKNIRDWAKTYGWVKSKKKKRQKKKPVKKKPDVVYGAEKDESKLERMEVELSRKSSNRNVADKLSEEKGETIELNVFDIEQPFKDEEASLQKIMKRVNSRLPEEKRRDFEQYKKMLIAVHEMLVGNYSIEKIVRFIVGKFGFTEGNVMAMIDIAKASITRNLEKRMDFVVANQLDGLRMIFRKAIDTGDLKTALDCSKEISKIYGLYSADKLTILTHSTSSQGKKFRVSTPMEYIQHIERKKKEEQQDG